MKYKPKTYVLVNKTDFFEQLHDEIEYSYADFDQYKMDILECEDIDDLPHDDFRYGLQRAYEIFKEYIEREYII